MCRNCAVDSFIAASKQNLGVEVDHQNTFVSSILISKKHYIGIQPDGKVVIKGMERKKRDKPPFFNQVVAKWLYPLVSINAKRKLNNTKHHDKYRIWIGPLLQLKNDYHTSW